MKKMLLLTLLLALCLTSCGDAAAVMGEGNPPPEDAAVQTAMPENEPEAPEAHTLSEGGNVVEHEAKAYCGNTVTTVTGPDGEQFSFWGSDSLALTDLLLYLDYSEGVCRCMPEYSVDTEFNAGYGIHLTEGYARHDGRQTALTAEQVELVQGIMDRQSGGGTPESIAD